MLILYRESERWMFWAVGAAGSVCVSALSIAWVYLKIKRQVVIAPEGEVHPNPHVIKEGPSDMAPGNVL